MSSFVASVSSSPLLRTDRYLGIEGNSPTSCSVGGGNRFVAEDLVETDDVSLVRGISFLTAIFHVDAEVATVIFTREGTLEAIMDAVNVSSFTPLALSVARLLAEASGHKKCRAILPPTTRQWLENQSRRGKDDQLAVACGVARVKLWQTSFADAAADGADPEEQSQTSVEDLVSLMQGIVVSEGVGSGVVEAVEGLAYLSTDPDMKERLSKDQNFLKHLFALIPDRKKRKSSTTNPPTLTNSPLLYGVITIIANLIGYRPMLSEEQRQIERLSQMSKTTQSTTKATKGDSKLNDDAQVKTRVRRLIDAGLLPILSALPSLTDSQGVHRNVARAFLSLTEDKDIRGLVLQAGGSKALQLIIRHLPPPPPVSVKKAASKPPLPAPLEAIQALAKLSITSSPLQVYGADVGPIHDALRPLSLLVLDSSANQLQQFEGAMALTNLASISPDFCSRIADLDGFLNKVELLLFEDHVLLRRAAMELICNLVAGSDKTFERYAGADGSSGIKSKLHLVLAICDVEDIPTRLAASGTLATLMNSPSACRTLFDLQMEKGRFLPIMTELVQPISVGAGEAEAKEDAGLIHRAMAPSKKAGKRVVASAKKPAAKGKVAKADWKEGFKKKQVGVSDMTLLTTISNESINENLQKRWTNAEIYTYIGSVLISVNPFRDLGIYTDEVLQRYRGKNRLEVPPHVFAIAEGAYYNMNAYNENQCVIISGESGAGKTEAAKRIMQYIAEVSGGQDSGIQDIKDMVLATNPLLESFGCAKTLRNNNSSRHGKYLEIMFNDRGEPVGAQITNYLLEKGQGERNFHIFYQFTKAATDEQREAFGLQGPEAYAYTSVSNCFDVSDIDDTKDYHGTLMLAVILWLGNVQFQDNDEGNSAIADTGVTDFVAYLMEVDPAVVQKALTTRVMETTRGGRRGSVYDVPLNPAQANSGRDALAKAIYNNLFEWIVSRVNVSLKTRSAYSRIIGILDIFGFEIFEDNSFEQLCINYVNEKLQQIFIELTLKREQEEYDREQIKWTPIKFFNNKVVCDLIEEKRPPGIFAALNDACATAHADPTAADNSFIQRTAALSSNLHFESRGAQFLVKHYAGDVMYNVAGMTDKNKDTLIKDLLDVIGSSGNSFLQSLFPDRPDPNSKKRPPTASDRIKQSAAALVEKLMKAQPWYIRTIKPNQNRSGSEYDTKAILHQIKYLGLQENIRVRRAGFAYRNTFEKIVERFYLLSPHTSYAGDYTWTGDTKSGCVQILKDTGIAKDEWQMGVTKAFIKSPETLFALETMRDRYWHNMAGRIQRAFRNYMRYKHECARRIQRFWKNNKEGLVFAQVRDYGHQLLAGRKERRRFSLLGYRRFMGDYLDINGKSDLGSEIGSACSIGGRGEPVLFSARGQVLVSKTGRSSKPSPRYIVLTGSAVYIVITTVVQGVPVVSLERKVPLVTIKSMQLSTLRDDWLILNLGPTPEGDPVLWCHFKTEFTTHLMKATQSSVSLQVVPTVEYTKKKEKKAQIQFIKDETVQKDDAYKSHTVHVASGEPPNSPKPGVVRPITSGKLLRAGGPSKPSRPKPKAQPLPGQSRPAAASNPIAPPPPPPPPPAAEPPKKMYRAIYNFSGQDGEMSLKKGDQVELIEENDNGWWLVMKDGEEAWAPHNYLEPVPVAAAPPPPPPSRVPRQALSSVTANASAAPVAVFPGIGGANGGPTPWKRPTATTTSTPDSSRPGSSAAKVPPPIAAKPKPGVKPPPPKPGVKPTVPAPKPNSGGAQAGRVGGGVGQMDLAAAVCH
ncbi:microfilament motor [Coprinellus micaceus]|uniref:Microfilament motor n=1 Tax=Coprinellus micaceus TaxID=71717 RepID=A0A4Y7TZ03_COPMI|nr:microfilament motor [Coprinellus micaceus]